MSTIILLDILRKIELVLKQEKEVLKMIDENKYEDITYDLKHNVLPSIRESLKQLEIKEKECLNLIAQSDEKLFF